MSALQKHLAALPVPVDLLLLLALGSTRTFASPAAATELSFSECLQLERSPIGSGGGGRAAKVLSVLEGMPAYLHCPRQREGGSNLKAAWTRMADNALLAVGTGSFTQDLRFQVSKPRDHESDWVLILRRANPNDQGCYLCEINTEPVSTLVPVYLKVRMKNVAEQQKRTERLSHEKEVDGQPRRGTRLQARIEGTTLVLNCSVERGQQEEAGFWPSIVWTRDGQPLEVHNEKKFTTDFRVSDNRDFLLFTLRVRDLTPARDSGVYSCEGERLQRSTQIVSLPAFNSAASCGRDPVVVFTLPLFFPIFLVFSSLFLFRG